MSTTKISGPFELVQEIYGSYRRRETARIFQLFAENIEIVQSPDLPWGGCYRGLDEARQFFAQLVTHLSSTATIERMIDAGDRVAVTGRTRGKVRANGAMFDVAFVHIWTIRSGRVLRAEFYIDHREMIPALDSEPAAARVDGETFSDETVERPLEVVSSSAA